MCSENIEPQRCSPAIHCQTRRNARRNTRVSWQMPESKRASLQPIIGHGTHMTWHATFSACVKRFHVFPCPATIPLPTKAKGKGHSRLAAHSAHMLPSILAQPMPSLPPDSTLATCTKTGCRLSDPGDVSAPEATPG